MNHPNRETLKAVAKGVAATVAAVVFVPPVISGVLGLAGMSATGPVAGSFAAGIQSTVYGGAVPSGSLFALWQSAAMGGAVYGTAQAATIGAVGLVGTTAMAVRRSLRGFPRN